MPRPAQYEGSLFLKFRTSASLRNSKKAQFTCGKRTYIMRNRKRTCLYLIFLYPLQTTLCQTQISLLTSFLSSFLLFFFLFSKLKSANTSTMASLKSNLTIMRGQFVLSILELAQCKNLLFSNIL